MIYQETEMKKNWMVLTLVTLMASLLMPVAFAQATGTVKGSCKNADGSPIVDGVIDLANKDTGRKYSLKTDKKGNYFSLGIDPGHYDFTLTKDGKEVLSFKNVTVGLDETKLDFDVKKETEVAAQGAGLTPEQLKALQEKNANLQKENANIKQVNEKIAEAKTAADAGDLETAIARMTEASQMGPGYDVVWSKLADYLRLSAPKQTDSAEKSNRLANSVTDYQKAIDIKQKAIDAGSKKPEDPKLLAAYYNNMADSLSKQGKTDDAIKAYNQAATLNPEGAASNYFNIGAVLTNAGKVDDAIVAFDKVIATDPTRADAYYWKGVNLVGKATLKGDKMVAPDGTAQAFNKYLELAPTGPYADPAKQMLASIGATVETNYGKKKGNPINTK